MATITYSAKRTINGNTYGLKVNHDAREFSRGYNVLFGRADNCNVPKKEINLIIEALKATGYKEI